MIMSDPADIKLKIVALAHKWASATAASTTEYALSRILSRDDTHMSARQSDLCDALAIMATHKVVAFVASDHDPSMMGVRLEALSVLVGDWTPHSDRMNSVMHGVKKATLATRFEEAHTANQATRLLAERFGKNCLEVLLLQAAARVAALGTTLDEHVITTGASSPRPPAP